MAIFLETASQPRKRAVARVSDQVALCLILDEGIKGNCAHMTVEGLETQSLVVAGTDITIIGGKLFKEVAQGSKLS